MRVSNVASSRLPRAQTAGNYRPTVARTLSLTHAHARTNASTHARTNAHTLVVARLGVTAMVLMTVVVEAKLFPASVAPTAPGWPTLQPMTAGATHAGSRGQTGAGRGRRQPPGKATHVKGRKSFFSLHPRNEQGFASSGNSMHPDLFLKKKQIFDPKRPRNQTLMTPGDGPQRPRAAKPSRGKGPHTGRRPAQPRVAAHPGP